MKQKLWLARLFGIGMFLVVLSLKSLFSQGTMPAATWEQIGPWGGDIRDIKVKYVDSIHKVTAAARPGKDSLVVASYGAGVFITDSVAGSGAGYWIGRNAGLPTRKVLCLGMRKIGYGDTMFVGLEGYGVYKTYDAGLNWQPAYGSGILSIGSRTVYALAVTQNTSWIVYAATDQGLWKTNNQGATWNRVADIPAQIVTDVVVNEYETGKVYASSGTNVYRSINNGNDGSWTALTLTGNTSAVNCLALAFTDSDTLYAGTEDGKIYEVSYPPPFYTYSNRIVKNDAGFPVYSIAINPAVDADLTGLLASGFVNVLRASDTLYVGTKYGFFQGNKQLDNNYAWVLKNDAITGANPGLGNLMIQSVCFYRGRKASSNVADWVFAGTGFNGIFYMANTIPGGGQSWTLASDSLPVGGLRAVSTSPLTSDLVYVGGGYSFGSDVANGAIWKSSNASSQANVTWTRVLPVADSATMGHVITSISQSYGSVNTVWAADSIRGIYKSTDAGTTWSLFYSGTGVGYVYVRRFTGTAPTAADSEVVYAAQKQNSNWKLLRSWKGAAFATMNQTFNYPITSIIADSGATQNLYVTTYGDGVWKSADSGVTFSNITTTNGTFNKNVFSLAVDSVNAFLYIGTEQGIFKSSNSGSTWVDDNTGAAGSNYGPEKVYNVYSQRDTVWAALSNKGVYYKTKKTGANGVSSWTKSNLEGYTNLNTSVYMPMGDTLMLRDLDGIYKWNHTTNDITPHVGYAISEIRATYRRTSAATLPVTNGTQVVGSGAVYVYIPDTISGVRNEYMDIPVRIVNATYVDTFVVTIYIPQDYQSAVATGSVITANTLCNGRTVTATWAASNEQVVVYHKSSTPFSTNTDTVLFRFRFQLASTQSLNDSMPRTNIGDSSIHLVSGKASQTSPANNGIATLLGVTVSSITGIDSTDLMWRTGTDSNATFYGSPNVTSLTAQNTSSTVNTGDSSAISWLRKYPDNGTGDNGLAGDTTAEVIGVTNWGLLGERGNVGYYVHQNLSTEKDWNYTTQTGRYMTVRILPSAYPTYPYLTWTGLPENSIRGGDAIGAFYYRNDTLVCAGWGVWRVDTGCTFHVWGDDDRTPLKDGFVDNEQLIFKIYDSRYKKVWPVPALYTYISSGTNYFVDGGISIYDRLFKGKQLIKMFVDGRGPNSLTAETRGGWHLISSYLYPADPGSEVTEIFKYVNNFLLLKDQLQNLYWPQVGINQILNWDIKKAYWVYFTNYASNSRSGLSASGSLRGTDVALFKGTRVDPTLYPLTLDPGWNLIPYLGNIAYPVQSALSSISGKYMLVQTDSGTYYWPTAGINQIGNMGPTTSTTANPGYKIYMTQAATLTYPAAIVSSMRSFGIGGGSGIPELQNPIAIAAPHFKTQRFSPNCQSLAIQVDGLLLKDGDELGVFTKEGVCIGSGRYNKNSKNVIGALVYGNDEMSAKDIKAGADEGEQLFIKVFTRADAKELNPKIVSVNWALGSGEGLKYQSNSAVLAKVSLTGSVLPTEYSIDQNYPNPFNPTTTIRYAIPEDGLVKIRVYDMLGREVKELVKESQMAGYYTIEWDGKNSRGLNVSTGVYMYRIEVNNFKKTIKMMLMK